MDGNMKRKVGVGVIALLGFITTIKLAMIYYDANFNPYALPSFCSVSDLIDCDGVAKTTESQFFGIPLAYWGLFLYSFIFLMLGADKLKNFKLFKFMEVFKNPLDYISSLGLLAFIISMVLLCVSLFDIKKLCVLCMATYLMDFAIALIATDFKNGGFVKSIKQSVQDFLDAIKNKGYLIAFIVVVLLAGAGLTYTATTNVFAPQVKRAKDFGEFAKAKTNKYKVSGNVLGDENAKVIVFIYTDYRCPICRVHNIMMHKLAKDVAGIKIVHKNLPLDTECNKYLTSPFHEGSCTMARYAMAAEKQGKFWDINTLFFEKQPNNEAEILDIAKGLGLNLEKLQEDANSAEIKTQLLNDIDEETKMGLNATPTTRIGQDVYVGIKPYSEYVKLVQDAVARQK